MRYVVAPGSVTLRVDPIRCDGVGSCAHLAPDLITIDRWGFPLFPRRPLTGDEVEAFIFAAIEKEPPYAAALYILNDEAVAKGRAEAQRLRALYAECKATDTWPAYGESIQVLTLPKWA